LVERGVTSRNLDPYIHHEVGLSQILLPLPLPLLLFLYSYSCYSSYYSYYSYYYFFFLYSTTPSGLHQTTRVARPRVWVAKGLRKLMMQPTSSSTYNKESGGGGGARPRVEVRAKGVRHRRRAEARGRAELGEGFTQPYRL